MSTQTPAQLTHISNLWDDAEADRLDAVERLRYRSNILGSDQRLTNTGGGNTSSKLTETDPLTGEEVEVLWVKGSGGDLRTAKRANFSSLYMHKLHALKDVYHAADRTGVKTPIEDAMVDYYPHCTFNLNPRPASIDTPLHAFIPYKHVDHMHPIAVIAIAASERAEELTKAVYGDEVGYLPWQRPGFDLGLKIEQKIKDEPHLKGIVLGGHGLINWADDDKECYELTLRLTDQAERYIAQQQSGAPFGGAKYQPLDDDRRHELLSELLPWLRGQVSQQTRFIGTVQSDATTQQFVNSHEAPRLAELGTSCPDHFLRTKIKPLYVDWDPQNEDLDTLKQRLSDGIAQYRDDYTAYYEGCAYPDSPPMRDPNPKVVLIPGIGMIGWAKNKSESRVTSEFYRLAIEVMRGSEAIDKYTSLPAQEAFDIEYWWLEEYKMRRKPADAALAGQVVAVIGAGSGIGRSTVHRLAPEDGHVVCVDLNADEAEAAAGELSEKLGKGIGVAGTGLSGCGPAIGLGCDVTDTDSIRRMLDQVTLAYGGLDHIIITAGLLPTPDEQGNTTDQQWRQTFDVNAIAPYRVAQQAQRIWDDQALDGALVIASSVNGVVPKNKSMAYDTSKAATNHLVRELAIELAPRVRVNAVAPATVVSGSQMFPRERVISSLAKYGVSFDENADTETLREQLADYYASRSLTHRPIRAEHQAEAIFFLLSDRASRTTGQILNVDGGLTEAFLR